MDDSSDGQSDRRGRIAPSSVEALELSRTRTITLGDIHGLEAYVRTVVAAITEDESEIEDLVAEGITLAVERHQSLAANESLQSALSYWLESRLRDYWRRQHREWRRNSRAGTAYAVPIPTGLAWEHGATTTAGMPATNDTALVQSRLALQLFNSEQDLRNPRLVGRYRGVPSAAALATGAAPDVWSTIEEERALSDRQNFRFLKHDQLD